VRSDRTQATRFQNHQCGPELTPARRHRHASGVRPVLRRREVSNVRATHSADLRYHGHAARAHWSALHQDAARQRRFAFQVCASVGPSLGGGEFDQPACPLPCRRDWSVE
jgi:hypothetical protein